jgi:outer membrane immunogenic protein
MNTLNSKRKKLHKLPAILERHKRAKLNGVAIVLGLLISTLSLPAFAADSSDPDQHDWTGLYFGVYGEVAASDGLLDDAFCRNNINTPDPDNCSNDDGDTDTPELYGAPLDGNAFAFGGLIGYNHQFNTGVVFGVESDLGLGGRGKGSFESSVFGVSGFDKGEINIGLAGSTRLRAGYALDQWLPYVTAGVAYAQYEADFRREDPNENRQGDGSFVGWTAGAGLNYAVSSNVIFGFEYRYTDYGSDTLLMFSNGDTNTQSYEASLKQHELRASVAYAMGAPAGAGGSQDASDWSGIYTGVYAGHASLDGLDDNSFCRLNAVFGECGGGTYGVPVDGGALTIGGLIGYNHQFSSGLVFGFEGDIGLGGKAEGTFVSSVGGPSDQTAEVDLGLNGSARLRAGYAVNNWLPFVTAGVAYAQYDVTTSSPNIEENRFGDGNLLGWTAGGGLNYAITNNVILGVEYRYTYYGSDTHLYYADTDGDLWSQDLDLTQHEVRASLAYAF